MSSQASTIPAFERDLSKAMFLPVVLLINVLNGTGLRSMLLYGGF